MIERAVGLIKSPCNFNPEEQLIRPLSVLQMQEVPGLQKSIAAGCVRRLLRFPAAADGERREENCYHNKMFSGGFLPVELGRPIATSRLALGIGWLTA